MLSDDAALVRVARSTPEGFAALYARYYRTVFAFVYRHSGDRALTEDINGGRCGCTLAQDTRCAR